MTSQQPEPGSRHLKFRGDTQTFSLTLSTPQSGTAFLRTNIGHAEITREEILRNVHDEHPPLGRDWFDVPMKRLNDRMFQVTLPLCEIGHFEGKCFFLKTNSRKPLWPSGPNTSINVEPSDTCCANIIYNAFVRQFGPNKNADVFSDTNREGIIQMLDKSGYAVIPPSGTFRDLIKELDFIIGQLGCRILQLLPIHPTPTTYARMGRFGSPYASLSFTAVDPALAEFDPCATPLEQFLELVYAVHYRNAKIFIDIAINHTGWAASLHETHPEWLVRKSDGCIEVPGAWGVRWEDLTTLDYTKKNLWTYMADVFLTWCRRGVDGFRCDAGYMIPLAAWKYIIASVRKQFPDTIFLLEGLGGKISVTRELLNQAGFNWAYSELFQNYSREQIQAYLPEPLNISQRDGITVHFAETHDNNRLASQSTAFAKMRTTLCALCSPNGAFGFANGVEWYATEKIIVHDSPSLNWGATINQVCHIHRISTLLKNHPAFHDQTDIQLVGNNDGNFISLVRHHAPSQKRLLILANLDVEHTVDASWHPEHVGITGREFKDLISGNDVPVIPFDDRVACSLAPGEVLCLTQDPKDLDVFDVKKSVPFEIPRRIQHQRYRAKAMDIFRFYNGMVDIEKFDPDEAARMLAADPLEFCRKLNPLSRESRVISWHWPRDLRREVMIPPEHFLAVFADRPFRAQIMDQEQCLQQEDHMQTRDGRFFALFVPASPVRKPVWRSLNLKLCRSTTGKHHHARILFLPRHDAARLRHTFHRRDILKHPHLFLGTNGRGGMLRANVCWGELHSKYDALLAGNLNPDFPEDRRVMLTRCRAWLVYQDYSQEICLNCLDLFSYDPKTGGQWRFKVPSGQGEYVALNITMKMILDENAVHLRFHRCPALNQAGHLPDSADVQLILRPDIEDRNFHENTKAYQGPEYIWPHSVSSQKKGFIFSPGSHHRLAMHISRGMFTWQPEWHYMVHHPLEAERGLDPLSDLFSPGYFSTDLSGTDTVDVLARIETAPFKNATKTFHALVRAPNSFEKAVRRPPIEVLKTALDQYIVERESLSSIIAGYPWFLDWGRDSLIVTRGLIASGKYQAARNILSLFGRFEKNGTIPNMIRGHDAGNRDTADAPLWFCVACSDLVHAEKNRDFLNTLCNGRPMSRILSSIVRHMMIGTPNGIRMDSDSGLLFSPAHFTWMDTDYPAGTPRQGYPIEIQALWFASLSFLSAIDSKENAKKWQMLAEKVAQAILEFFWIEESGYLSDCLHAEPLQAARLCQKDDALRPNQLFAVTLGALRDDTSIRKLVSSCEELLVPGALRSLADRPVRFPLRIVHHGHEINDPLHPYRGEYRGDEDTERKPAYHNGTAWAWLLPTFCEAWVKAYGMPGMETALSFLSSGLQHMNQGCVGHIPEILDGDAPHAPRGCDAQAWSVSELLRVWLQLDPLQKK